MLNFVTGDSSLSTSQLNYEEKVTELETQAQSISVADLVTTLDPEIVRQLGGKLISYYNRKFKNFVFIGCIPALNETAAKKITLESFTELKSKSQTNALSAGTILTLSEMVPSQKEVQMLTENLKNPTFEEELKKHQDRNHPRYEHLLNSTTLVFRVREKANNDSVKALVRGKDHSAGMGSRRTKERKIGEVIFKV